MRCGTSDGRPWGQTSGSFRPRPIRSAQPSTQPATEPAEPEAGSEGAAGPVRSPDVGPGAPWRLGSALALCFGLRLAGRSELGWGPTGVRGWTDRRSVPTTYFRSAPNSPAGPGFGGFSFAGGSGPGSSGSRG